jgi:hypothetical protein
MEQNDKTAGRREFDYQERWHGWKSPVGLGLFIMFCGIAIGILNLSTGGFIVNLP